MPIFDKCRVDLVLQGHDHTYGRTGNVRAEVNVRDDQSGTVYVVSVSGPKMYDSAEHPLTVRLGEDLPLYQVIAVDGNKLSYESRTATGELYDVFELHKQDGGTNLLVSNPSDDAPESRRGPTILSVLKLAALAAKVPAIPPPWPPSPHPAAPS